MPALRELLRLAKEQSIDIVVCRHHNRLARTAGLLLQISAYLRQHRVQIYAYEAPVEPSEPATMSHRADTTRLFVEGFAGLVSEADNLHRVARNLDGMRRRIERGGHPAGEAPYGYQDIIAQDGIGRSHRKRIVNPAEYAIICEVFALLKAGYSARYIAQLLAGEVDGRTPVRGRRGGRIDLAVILQWAHNPWYYGKTYRSRFQRRGQGQRGKPKPLGEYLLLDSNHECPCTWDDWAIVHQRIKERDTAPPRWKRQARPWQGVAFCGYCLEAGRHGAMRHRIDIQHNLNGTVRRYEYLYCQTYSSHGTRGCQRNGMPVADFLAGLYGAIAQLAADPAARRALDDTPLPISGNSERLRREVIALEEQERRWDEAYAAGAIDLAKYAERLKDSKARRAVIETQLRQDEALRTARGEVRQHRDEALAAFTTAIDTGHESELARLVRQIVERVIVKDEQLTIVWR